MRSRTRAGFTLIELLVVIAIIAILAAILFPIFLSAKAAAYKSTCCSNIGQLSKAMLAYATDYQGRIPDWQTPDPPQANVPLVIWDQTIWGYVKNKQIFSCPLNRIDSSGKPYAPTVMLRSYCLPKNVARQFVEQAPRPSATVLLYEKGSQPVFTQPDSTGEWFTQTYGYSQDPPSKFWHDQGKNFAFCDGHAKYFKYPAGPFSYDYPNFIGWSTAEFPNNPGGRGYCGYADTTAAATPSGAKMRGGANLPR
jgi:prepilin-type N-terminal cleavage/methylation domain-containing protein/prepilin-type processing-associated H-X9-DG protein